MAYRPYRQLMIYEYKKPHQITTISNINAKTAILIYNNRFDNKLRRTVRMLLDFTPEFVRTKKNLGINGISQVANVNNSVCMRIVWAVILFGCFFTCMFQVYDRLSYYFTVPVVVDVKIEEEPNLRFPSITISSTDTEGALKLIRSYNITIQPRKCTVLLTTVLNNITGSDTAQLWAALNVTPSVVMAAVVTRKGSNEVTWNEEVGQLGTQIRFELDKSYHYEGIENKFVVKVRKYLHSCTTSAILGSIQPNGMPSDTKNSFVFETLSTFDMFITTKKFVFLNRKSQLCTDDETYLQCWKQCTIQDFRNLSCRFPFMPEDFKTPTCISGPRIGDLYGEILIAISTLHCQCPRRCHETAFVMSIRFVNNNENVSIVNMYLATNRITIITERFAYDIISLLSDIGGVLGLSLGLSVLSIFDVLQKMVTSLKSPRSSKKERFHLFHTDPVLQLVKRVLKDELSRYHQRRNNLKRTTTSRIWQVVLLSLVISCVLGSGLFMYARFSKYWSVPTHMAVNIVYKEAVNFPNITICSLSKLTLTSMKRMAKKRKIFRRTSSDHQMIDWCNLQFTDLLDSRMTADSIWKKSSVFKELEESLDITKMLFNKSLIENVSMRDVNLPDGKCVEIHIGERLFAGSRTQFSRGFLSQALLGFEEELVECGRDYYQIFITPPNELFHVNTRLLLPIGMRSSIILESKQVTLWNTTRNPCVENEVAKECHHRCFHTTLQDNINCRLPYMPQTMKKVPICNNSKSGKLAQVAYLSLALTLDPLQHKDCRCLMSCTRTIVSSSVSTEPHSIGKFTFIDMLFFNNIYEHITEIPADSLSSLLCDIGGNLGLTLGLSLLSVFDTMQSFFKKLAGNGK